jgi:hypothetical protein
MNIELPSAVAASEDVKIDNDDNNTDNDEDDKYSEERCKRETIQDKFFDFGNISDDDEEGLSPEKYGTLSVRSTTALKKFKYGLFASDPSLCKKRNTIKQFWRLMQLGIKNNPLFAEHIWNVTYRSNLEDPITSLVRLVFPNEYISKNPYEVLYKNYWDREGTILRIFDRYVSCTDFKFLGILRKMHPMVLQEVAEVISDTKFACLHFIIKVSTLNLISGVLFKRLKIYDPTTVLVGNMDPSIGSEFRHVYCTSIHDKLEECMKIVDMIGTEMKLGNDIRCAQIFSHRIHSIKYTMTPIPQSGSRRYFRSPNVISSRNHDLLPYPEEKKLLPLPQTDVVIDDRYEHGLGTVFLIREKRPRDNAIYYVEAVDWDNDGYYESKIDQYTCILKSQKVGYPDRLMCIVMNDYNPLQDVRKKCKAGQEDSYAIEIFDKFMKDNEEDFSPKSMDALCLISKEVKKKEKILTAFAVFHKKDGFNYILDGHTIVKIAGVTHGEYMISLVRSRFREQFECDNDEESDTEEENIWVIGNKNQVISEFMDVIARYYIRSQT